MCTSETPWSAFRPPMEMKMGSGSWQGGTKEPPMHADSRRSTTPRWNHRWTRMDTDRASLQRGLGSSGKEEQRNRLMHADKLASVNWGGQAEGPILNERNAVVGIPTTHGDENGLGVVA